MYKHIEGIIFDWAGTTVDYGCFAPVNVFLSIFKEAGIEVTLEEAREPMGLLKWDHIKAMLEIERISNLWKERYGRPFSIEDVNDLYSKFEPQLISTLDQFSDPIDHVVAVINNLKEMGLKIGSTTGYTENMIEVVARGAKEKGYQPDCIVTPDSTDGIGRPKPYMIFENMKKLSMTATWRVVKVGDTISDIKEAVNASVWNVGIIIGSSLLGMEKNTFDQLTLEMKEYYISQTKNQFLESGADFVINTMEDLPVLLEKIDELIELGKRPNGL